MDFLGESFGIRHQPVIQWKMVKSRKSNRLIPLNEAVWRFAPRKLRDEFERAQSPTARTYPAIPNEGGPIERSKIALLMLSSAFDDFASRNEPLWEMQKHLIRRLSNGTLQAFGMMTKPDLGSQQEIIPSIFFKGHPKVSWSRNSIENLERKFELVEIQRTESFTRTNVQPKLTAAAGRPRVDAPIAEVARELEQKGSFEGRSEKEIVALTQLHCRRRHPKLFRKDTQPSKSKVREVLKSLGI